MMKQQQQKTPDTVKICRQWPWIRIGQPRTSSGILYRWPITMGQFGFLVVLVFWSLTYAISFCICFRSRLLVGVWIQCEIQPWSRQHANQPCNQPTVELLIAESLGYMLGYHHKALETEDGRGEVKSFERNEKIQRMYRSHRDALTFDGAFISRVMWECIHID